MVKIKLKDKDFELKFNMKLDLDLNKEIKEDDDEKEKKLKHKVTGGISKVINDLIDQDFGTLAKVIEVAAKGTPGFTDVTLEDALESVEQRLEEDGEDDEKLFREVFEAIDNSAFSRKELKKFASNMKLVRHMRSKDMTEETATAVLNRLNENYKTLTNKNLFDEETLKSLQTKKTKN